MTSRITLTTTATVLSVLDPVRVYQDFATLDLVSHGRDEIIAGRSAFAEPFALFGEDIAQLDDLYAEKLDLLLRLRGEDRVTWTHRVGGTAFRLWLRVPARSEPLPRWARKPHQRSVHLGRARRLRKGTRGVGSKRLEKVTHKTPPCLRRSVPRASHHTSVGHQDQRHVLVREILTQPAGSLCPVKKFGQSTGAAVTLRLEGLRGRKCQGEHIGEATVVGLHLADPLNETAEAMPRIGIGQRVVDGGRISTHLVGEHRPHQVVTGWETAEKGGHAHTGAAGDLVGGSIQALLSEHLAGCAEHPLPVPLGISPQSRPRGRSLRVGDVPHIRTLPDIWNSRSTYRLSADDGHPMQCRK